MEMETSFHKNMISYWGPTWAEGKGNVGLFLSTGDLNKDGMDLHRLCWKDGFGGFFFRGKLKQVDKLPIFLHLLRPYFLKPPDRSIYVL